MDRRLASEERGFTLIEVLIAGSLLIVVLGVALDGLFTLSRSSTKAQVQTFSAQLNRVGMERLTRLLRQAVLPPAAPPTDPPNDKLIVTAADLNTMSFYSRLGGSATASDVNNTIYKFTIDLSGTTVRVGRSACTPDVSTGKCTWPAPVMSTLITGVQNATADQVCSRQGGAANTPLFDYYQEAAANGTLSKLQLDATHPIPLSQVVAVGINLYTQIPAAGDPKTCQPLVQQVELRNTNPI
jgi:type II secretory pathway pseudopilin PulG